MLLNSEEFIISISTYFYRLVGGTWAYFLFISGFLRGHELVGTNNRTGRPRLVTESFVSTMVRATLNLYVRCGWHLQREDTSWKC